MEYKGEEIDIEQTRAELTTEREAQNRFLKIGNGEIAELHLTGKAYKKTNSFGKTQIDFELEDKNKKGEFKLFSLGAYNTCVQELFEAILNGSKSVKVMRTGMGTKTSYIVVT